MARWFFGSAAKKIESAVCARRGETDAPALATQRAALPALAASVCCRPVKVPYKSDKNSSRCTRICPQPVPAVRYTLLLVTVCHVLPRVFTGFDNAAGETTPFVNFGECGRVWGHLLGHLLLPPM